MSDPRVWDALSQKLRLSPPYRALRERLGEAVRLPVPAAAWVGELLREDLGRRLLVLVPHESDALAWTEAARLLAGSQRDTISHNVVTNNRGNTLFSGGIVLITNTLPNPDGSFDVSKDNLVTLNRLSGNEPADIVTDAASTPNVFVGNRCDTSIPDGLCSF